MTYITHSPMLSGMSDGALGALPVFDNPAMKQAAKALSDLIRANRSAVRRYLIKYGAEDRAFSRGTTIKLTNIPGGPQIKLSKSVIDKDNEVTLAGKLAATIFHDPIHAARIGASVGLGLGSYGSGLGIVEMIIPLLTSLGPMLIPLITGFLKPQEPAPAAAAAAAPPPPPPPPAASTLPPYVIPLGIAAALGIGFLALRK